MIDIIDILRKHKLCFQQGLKNRRPDLTSFQLFLSNIYPIIYFVFLCICLLSYERERERESFNLELVLQILYYKHGNLAMSCCVLHPPIPLGQGRGKGGETNDDLYNSLVKKRYIMKTPTYFQKSKKYPLTHLFMSCHSFLLFLFNKCLMLYQVFNAFVFYREREKCYSTKFFTKFGQKVLGNLCGNSCQSFLMWYPTQ